jgi:ketosteroid isomerase-like protein
MNQALRTTIQKAFDAVMAKDLEGLLSLMSDDALLWDPHYPNPQMRGKQQIRNGLIWGFKGMKSFGFTIVNYFESEDGQKAVVEVDTNHVLGSGMKLHFPQIFVVETKGGLITRLQAYEPYSPGGIAGAFIGLNRLAWKIQGKE